MAKRDVGMIAIIPNYDYEGQSEAVKERLCKHDYGELCNLLRFKQDLCRARRA